MTADVTLGEFVAHPLTLLLFGALIGAIGWGSQRIVNRMDRVMAHLDSIDDRLAAGDRRMDRIETRSEDHMRREEEHHALDALDRASRQADLDQWRGRVEIRLDAVDGRLAGIEAHMPRSS